jgi:hypothetical protein
MLLIKACQRCGGDLVYERNARDDEALAACVQCGFEGYRLTPAIPDRDTFDSPRRTMKPRRRAVHRGRTVSIAP